MSEDNTTRKRHRHEELGLTFAEYGALLGTRAMLERGTLEYEAGRDWVEGNKHLFCMNRACRVKGCGTVSCIGGTMALIMGMDQDEATAYVNKVADGILREALRCLFFPRGYNYEAVTPDQAVQAIDNYLRTGRPQWASVLVDQEGRE